MRLPWIALAVLVAWPVVAKPPAPLEFCRTYPDAAACAGGQPDCALCHSNPPARNAYGAQVESMLAPGAPRPLSDPAFVLALPEALRAVEALDADGDDASNLEELLAGSLPADASSGPVYAECSAEEAARASVELQWNVCAYDADYVFQKVLVDFCGRSPTLTEKRAFRESADQMSELHAVLDKCLQSEHWRGRDGAVWSLAHEKVLPTRSVKSGEDAGEIPLADYLDDYNLFVYAHTGDRDVRDVLLAQYFVERTAEGELVPFERTPEEDFAARGYGGAQMVPVERRAGMITARWFLMSNTMFTAVPRTTAAQAYRAYLGYDIARMEGLHSAANEPADYDNKGVQRAECAACHSTLDPLTYPFSRYEGIGGGDKSLAKPANLPFGLKFVPYTYNPTRLDRFVEVDGASVVDTPEAGALFGAPVANLLEWAELAANSDAFARTVVEDYWKLLLGSPPTARDSQEFTALWKALRTTHNYRVEKMLHALIETEAYGVP
jgi:hypothetical protein